MPTIYIDGQAYEVEEGKNLLEACLNLGLDLPYFCWHPSMGSIGSCRQCAMVQYQNEEDTRGRIVMGCMTPVTDGARLSLNGESASEFRESIIESLMLNHPHDCPVCAEGGECHLQDMTVMVGHRDRNYRGNKNTHRNQYLGPLINHEMNRCISCYRCVRFYRDYAGGTDLAALASHDHVYFGRHQDGVLQSEFAGNLAEVCPTGVFTDKPLLNDYSRKWDLQSAPSVCVGCAVGCNTSPGERYGRLKRIQNRYNQQVNGYFLCDRGRFGGDFVNSESRLNFAGIKQADGSYQAVKADDALSQVASFCQQGTVAAIGSPRASVEANYLLRRLAGNQLFSTGMSDSEQALVQQVFDTLSTTRAMSPSLHQIESADAVLILGEDVSNTAPRLALALRQAARNKALALAADMRLEPWMDAAIRNLAQDQYSPVFIVGVNDSRLTDISETSISLAPDDIARLGFAVAGEITGASIGGLSDELAALAGTIASALKTAKNPLIVSGTSLMTSAIIHASAAVAEALAADKITMLSLSVPECNSLGVAMLDGGEGMGFDALTASAKQGEIDTLIVMENDLYRRAPVEVIDQLLGNIKHLVVLDALDNATLSTSQIALPVATFAESEGTLVSSEGRAQRYYPVFVAEDDRLPSWQWLSELGQVLGLSGFDQLQHFDQVEQACAQDIPVLSGITAAAPDHQFRNRGLKIPRQPVRYSGRTAMLANVSVHEPKQPVDEETPLSFSMEGLNVGQPSSLMSSSWSPGWNSNQSIQKFQDEAGGTIKGGSAGVRLISPGQGVDLGVGSISVPEAFPSSDTELLLVPIYRVFGSDELSHKAPAINELSGDAQLILHPNDANSLQVADGDGVTAIVGDAEVSLEVLIDASIASGCVGITMGMSGTQSLVVGSAVSLQKASDWQRRKPQLIATDNPNAPNCGVQSGVSYV
ncbi:MAG: NADH-quinone oxidoreductase subunit NuoG [Porticoccus sp.]